MLETMHYSSNNDHHSHNSRKPSFSTNSDPSSYSNGVISMTTKSNKINQGSMASNDHHNELSSSSSSGANNNNNRAKPSPFEKLVNNLKNNHDYKKEMYLNRLIGFYRIGSEIGTGNFSQVRLALHLLTRERVAIKILNKTKLDEKTQRLLLREISSMQKLHHPNIIRLYEVIHTQERLYICMEYAAEGELYTKISNDGRVNETQARIIFSQVLSAVEHMHSKQIIHRDIKAENIFFSCMDPYVIKVGDFGFSIEAGLDKQLNTYCGSPPYAAPELFRDDSYIGVYVDIWALGVLLFFIVTGLMPFKADTVNKLKRVILSGEYIIPSFVSNSCQLLIKGILKSVPTERFTIKEIKDSAWLDHENRIEALVPFQLNPTLDKSELKTEEIYSLKILEKLGITKNYLIACNLPTSPNNDSSSSSHPHSLTHFHSHMQLTSLQTAAIAAPACVTMDNLISNKSTLNYLSSQAYNYQRMSNMPPLTKDIKQSVNGTYRIVYHSVQKKLRNEWTSDNINDTFVNREFRNILSISETGSSGHHSWNGANTTLLSLQNQHHSQTASNWPSFELPSSNLDDDDLDDLDTALWSKQIVENTTRKMNRFNFNQTTTVAASNNMNREMVNLGSIDNDEKSVPATSAISSNKNSTDSNSAGAAGGGGGNSTSTQHNQQPQLTKSIFVRGLRKANTDENSVQSAPFSENSKSESASHHSHHKKRPSLKSSKSVPKHIYASSHRSSDSAAKSYSNPSTTTSKPHHHLQNSKLCSIL